MSNKLLTCPWCGEEMRFDADSVHCWYKCDNCLATSPKALREWDKSKSNKQNWQENEERALYLVRAGEWHPYCWISVSEFLPVADDRYLVMASDSGEVEIAMYYGDGEWLTEDLENITRVVTHWIPIPELQEEDDHATD